MLDKSAFYHGAAIIPILEDPRCRSIRKRASLGYVVNEEVFVFLKYTSKARTPWRFTFDQEDINRTEQMSKEYRRLVFGLVCGGDGICGADGVQFRKVLGTKPSWIAAARMVEGYWHIKILRRSAGDYFLQLPHAVKDLALAPYQVSLSST